MIQNFILSLAILASLSACGGGNFDPSTLFPDDTIVNNADNSDSNNDGNDTADSVPTITLDNGQLLSSAILNDTLDLLALSDIALEQALKNITYLTEDPAIVEENNSTSTCSDNSGDLSTMLYPPDETTGHRIELTFGSSDGSRICQYKGQNLFGTINITNIIYTPADEPSSGNWQLSAAINLDTPGSTLTISVNASSRKAYSGQANLFAQSEEGVISTSLSLIEVMTITKTDPTDPTAAPWYENLLATGLNIATTYDPETAADIKYGLAMEGIVHNSITGLDYALDISTTGSSAPLLWQEPPVNDAPPDAGVLSIEDNTNISSVIMTATFADDYFVTVQINGTSSSDFSTTTWEELLDIARNTTP